MPQWGRSAQGLCALSRCNREGTHGTAAALSEGMTNHELQGNWKAIKGKVKTKWGELTNDEIDQIDGKRDQLVGAIQKRYGKKRDAVEREVSEFFDNLAS